MSKTIKILSTSDVHGFVYPTDFSSRKNVTELGLLKAGSFIKQTKANAADNEIVVALENGDLIQGSPLTSYLADHSDHRDFLSSITKKIGYDAGILGNHEFNYGFNYIKSSEAARNYPILNANIDGAIKAGIADKPYTIIERNGVKIAILGLTTAFIPNWELAKNIPDLKFNSILPIAKQLIPGLRKQADIVIVSYHGGIEADPATGEPTEKYTVENEGYRLLTEVPGIDALVTGHQHRTLATKINGVPFTQPGVHGTNVGEITLTLDDDKHVIANDSQLISTAPIQIDPELVPDSTLNNTVQNWLDQPMGTVAGADMRIDDPMAARLHGHPYLELINQVQMDALGTDIASTALFSNDLTGYGREVSMREIINNYPYPNLGFLEKVSGADLKAALERCASFFTLEDGKVEISKAFTTPKLQLFNYDFYSGIDYEFDLNKPVGSRLTKLEYHGQSVTDKQSLLVAMNNYRGIGGGEYSMFGSDKLVKQTSDSIQNLTIEYLKKHHPYQAIQPHNFNVIK
ncbi:bifunctional metallophosphatase/5'-nucleotidase [Fructilactobacillus sp. Tb1]|uniref:bifunctional metallophosphatase/5'-nucleotidase n=1 Tax=Fructilactobacillus sp. Tb1 TaxID=3422304 RepID=UPI003D2B3C40